MVEIEQQYIYTITAEKYNRFNSIIQKMRIWKLFTFNCINLKPYKMQYKFPVISIDQNTIFKQAFLSLCLIFDVKFSVINDALYLLTGWTIIFYLFVIFALNLKHNWKLNGCQCLA